MLLHSRQKKLLTEKDIYIRPNIDDLSTTDWSDLPESLNRGQTLQSNFWNLISLSWRIK